ncbi:MAG: hypothetical protein E6J78_13510 [Deltaproteobacteria bacterium]|nr:MAG: hypothetical protein E6J78_13510 [Deltaproteobacteria bacterium]
MKILGATAVLWLAACAGGQVQRPDELARWRAKYPNAAQELCLFARDYPIAAARVRQWLRDHPIEARDLVEWGANHPGVTQLPPSLYTRPSWLGYRPWRDPAVYALLDWASAEPEAARALASSPRALEWALDSRDC